MDQSFVGVEVYTILGALFKENKTKSRLQNSVLNLIFIQGPSQDLGRGPCKGGDLKLKLHYFNGKSPLAVNNNRPYD